MTKTVRYENAVVFQGAGLPLLDSITIHGTNVAEPDLIPDEVIDCSGAAILPGFGDAHCHPLLAARGSMGPKLEGCESIEAVRDKVRAWAVQNPRAEWIIGGFYDRDLAPEGRFDRSWLDDLDSRPIVLHSADQHAIWVNTEALRRANLPESGPLPFGVDLANGSPLGTLREDAKQFLLENTPPVDLAELAEAIKKQLDYLASIGVVYALDAWVDDAGLEAYRLVEHPTRVDTAYWVTPDTSLEKVPDHQSVKLFVDGVIGSATALVREPYVCETAHKHGVSSWKRKAFENAIRYLANGSRDVFIHTIGDLAIDWVLDAADGLEGIHLEHAELLSEDQITRVIELGFSVCFQPLWARPDAMMRNAERTLGTQRASRLYPTAQLLKSGGKVVFGSDWPVSSGDPLLGIFTAIHRTEPKSRKVHNSENRISVEEAIAAYSTGDTSDDNSEIRRSARVPRQLVPGARADLVVLTGNPFADEKLWAELKVAKTISGGQLIFARH